MWRTVTFTVLATALLQLSSSSGVAQAYQVALTNKCNEPIEVWHLVEGSERKEVIGAGKSSSRTLSADSPSNVFKKDRGGQATLAEITGKRGKVWIDISIIPTGVKNGPDACKSLADCKRHTGGVGFNVPMQIIPSKPDGGRCRTLTCMADGCADAYQFPADNDKTHACPGGTDIEVVFCAGGTGGQTPSPLTPSPTPTSTPAPTLSPTLATSETPRPTVDAGDEERGAIDTNASSNSTTSNAPNDNRLKLDALATNNEVAADADALVITAAAPVVDVGDKAPGASDATAGVVEVSTQSKAESSTGTEVYVLSCLGGVCIVAVAAIVVVRRKQQTLDSENVKTPRDRAMTAAAALMMLTTPKDNVTVL